MKDKRIVVGITGASGAVYGHGLIRALSAVSTVEIHTILSITGRTLVADEIGNGALQDITDISHRTYDNNDLSAPIASGSFLTEGMVIAPCSAKTLSSIAHSYGDTLISRAADVTLKERRRLIVLFRETPLNLSHIENMASVSKMGGVVMPPVPAFYMRPVCIQDIVNHSIGKVLDLLGIDHDLFHRWGT